MSTLKTKRIKTGHYYYEHEELGRFEITRDDRHSRPRWQAEGLGLCVGYQRTKKACVRLIARHIEQQTGEKIEAKTARSSNRTFRGSHGVSMEIRRHLPYQGYGCVPISFARALLRHEDATDEEIGMMAAMISDDLDDVDNNGMHRGDLRSNAEKIGLNILKKVRSDENGWGYRSERLPTVAQFLRNNPRIKTAIFRTTGHAGYYEDGVAYSLGARARIDYALVLEWRD